MLAQGGGKLTALPRAVRNQEIEESPLFSGFLPFAETPRAPCEFEKPHPLIHIGLVRGLVLLDLRRQRVCSSRQDVDIRVQPVLQALVFGLKSFDGPFMLACLICMTRMQRL